MKLIVSLLIAWLLVFVIYWLFDPTFPDWWRNQPTMKDPDRWDRYKQSQDEEVK